MPLYAHNDTILCPKFRLLLKVYDTNYRNNKNVHCIAMLSN